MNPIHLRKAHVSDAPLLAAIMHAAFEEYRGVLDPPSSVENETPDSVERRLKKGSAALAYRDEKPVGCVFYQPQGDHLYLGRLSVLPQHRGQGIARALIEYVEHQAAAQGLPRVQLNVRVALPHMQAYYTRLGYQPVRYGTHEGYTQPTYVTMEKEIPSRPIP